MKLIRGLFKLVGGTIKWAVILGVLVIVAVIIIAIVGVGKGVSKANKEAAHVAPLFGKVTVGESEAQVRHLLGKPSSTQSQDIEGEKTTYWYYGVLSTNHKGDYQFVFQSHRLTAKNRY